MATTIQSMLGLISVDPLNKVHLLHNQAMTLVFMDHMQLTTSEMADVYGKIGLAGVYLSTQELDSSRWTLVYNTYYVLFKYQIDITTGGIETIGYPNQTITKIQTRRDLSTLFIVGDKISPLPGCEGIGHGDFQNFLENTFGIITVRHN